jgi:two-component system response regulator (stage 0 sporulation protein A)
MTLLDVTTYAPMEPRIVENFSAQQLMVDKRRPLVIITGVHAETRLMMRCLPESWQFEVIEAQGGPDSVEAAVERHPDLILMDATLPFDESLETMIFIKGNLPDKNVPLVVVSGFARKDMAETAIAHGANYYLVKPLDFVRLPDYLTSMIARH